MATLHRVCLIGFDRIVGSFALGLRRSGFKGTIVGVDNPETISKCWKLGMLNDGTDDLEAALTGAELILLAAENAEGRSRLPEVLSMADDGAVISEMTRVKGNVNRIFEQSSRRSIHYVGFRLLGDLNTNMDVSNAHKFFFEGKTVILTPRGKQDLEAYQTMQGVMQGMGATVVAMSPQAHDRLLALQTQVPMTASLAIMQQIFTGSGEIQIKPEMLAGWLMDELRKLAAGKDSGLLEDLEANRDLVIRGVDDLIEQLRRLREHVTTGELKKDVETLLTQAGLLLKLDKERANPELVLVAGSDTKVLERIAELFAKQHLPLGKLEKLENGEPGTYKMKMESMEDREKALGLLRRAGIEVVDLSL